MDPAANLSSKIWKEYSTRNQPTNNISHEDRSMLLNLSFLEQKIHQLQDLVRLTVTRDKRAVELSEIFPVQRQQLMTADITSIIVQLISVAGSLLPSLENSLLINPVFGQLQSISGVGFAPSSDGHKPQYEENILKDEGVDQPLGSYEVLQLEKEEILAPHAHFCLICGKGFKRDANLRMHMRGHGDQYKTLAALAKPSKEPGLEPVLTKRYSCPYSGCKHNKDHINFQPLKTMLCVKNHYKRTHCEKNYTCSRCNRKMFSVLADLKTHEKHCGSGKWLCSCRTTFSRKEKLFGHVALFQGHTPAIPVEKSKRSCGTVNGRGNDEASKIGGMEFRFSPSFTSGNGVQNVINAKEGLDDPTTFFSSLDYDSFNFAGFENFPPPPFDISGNSLAYRQAESSEYLLETGNEPSYASPK